MDSIKTIILLDIESTKQEEVTEKLGKLKVEDKKEEEEEKKEKKEEVKENPMRTEGEVEVVEGVQEFHRNQASKFLSTTNDWDDEKLALPEKIKQALKDADVLRPSKIQAYAIPLIQTEPYKSVVAQYHNGSGKTFAFALSALLRIDPDNKNMQVLVFAHTRELVHQIYEQIQLLNKYTEYNVVEVKKEDTSPKIGQITVVTPAK